MNESSTAVKTGIESGLWARLRFSPLRDVLRGRLSGRLDLKRRVADAHLPSTLESLVLDVAGATRLTGLERIDVAHELIAHFQDGLESGADSNRLVHRPCNQ